MILLEIEGLTASIDGRQILKGLDLSLTAGEVHAVMGPNGSGKTTLAKVLAGHEAYEVTGGRGSTARTCSRSTPEERAAAGVFLAFQYPIEIPGVATSYFLRPALNAVRRAPRPGRARRHGLPRPVREQMKLVEMDRVLMTASSTRASRVARRSATRSCRWRSSNRRSRSSTRPTRPRHRCAADRGRGRQQHASPDRAMLVITHYQRLLD